MHLILKLIRHEQFQACRNLFNRTTSTSRPLLSPDSYNVPKFTSTSFLHRRFIKTTSVHSMSADQTKPKSSETKKDETIDDIPIVKFKTYDVKKIFKEFYSLYGPLFVGCHIVISLTSLGFFSALVWLNVDLTELMPYSFQDVLGQKMTVVTGHSGKFVIAYAIHKFILPVRLAGAVYTTRFLSRKLTAWKQAKELGKQK